MAFLGNVKVVLGRKKGRELERVRDGEGERDGERGGIERENDGDKEGWKEKGRDRK